MLRSNKRSNNMSKDARDIEEAMEGVLSHREMAFELLDVILEDDELTAADMVLCGELHVACMMMYRHMDALRSYQEHSRSLFADNSAELFNELVDSIGESCEEILGFEALLAGTFSASLCYESPYAAEEHYLDEFMDTDEPPEEPEEDEPDYLCDDDVRNLLHELLFQDREGGVGALQHHAGCAGYGERTSRAKATESHGDHEVSVKLVCGADVPERFEHLLKRGIEQAIQDTARTYRAGNCSRNQRCKKD